MSSPATTRKARILIVDDEWPINYAFRRVFDNGYEAHGETDPLIALERLLSDEEFDCVFLDIMMPNMNGFVLFETLEKQAPNRIKRIVFLTGGALIPAVQEFFAKHRAVYLEKPMIFPQIEGFIEMLAACTFPRGK